MRRTIALTRATEDAERSTARLLELGYASFVAPVTMVLATQAGIPRCDYDAVVATSAKAFDLLSPFSRDAILALPLFVVGAQTDACVRSTLHGAFVRGYDATLVSDAHTTEDGTAWGAPPPDKVIAHTNLYWTYQTAPGRTAGTVETKNVDFRALS